MKNVVVLLLAGALVFLMIGNASAQGGLDYLAEPNYGTSYLRAGFTPDPHSLAMTSGGSVAIADYFSSGSCAGYATSSPDYRIRWSGDTDTLRVFFVGEGDTTMVVRTPAGQ